MNRHAKAASAGSTSGRAGSSRRNTVRGAFACVLALLAFAGIGASTAGAAVPAKGVTGFFGSAGDQAGQMTTPLGVAVNETTGNVYAADSSNRRVVSFDSNGNFLRAWGLDVVANGPGNKPTQLNSETIFEICAAAGGDVCQSGPNAGGAFGGQAGALVEPRGVAVNQTTGDVYVTDSGNRRVGQYAANGNFIRAFGKDVVISGPGNVTQASAVQTLTVTATAGKYTLAFGGKETTELTFNSTAAQIQTALQGLASIGTGNATVAETSAGVFKVTFAGALANNPEPLILAASGAGEPLVGGTASVANTTAGSNGYEICVPANGDICKQAVAAGQGTTGGAFAAAIGYPTVAPAGAPNAGNLLVADAGNRRVQEFSPTGVFIRTFGFDVVKAGPGQSGTGFEVCSAANGDACQVAAASGSGSGQFATLTPTGVAEDAAGNIYTVEPTTNFRVQKFTLPGNVPTPQGNFADADLKGTGAADAPGDVAVNPSTGTVSVVKGFSAGATPSCPITAAASVAEARVLELSAAGTLEGTHGACAGITPMSGIAVRGSNNNLYAGSAQGQHIYVLNTGQPAAPTAQITGVSGVDPHKVTVNALINPGGPELPYGLNTTYKLEYKRSTDAGYSTLFAQEGLAGNRTTSKAITASLDGLQPGSSYDVRLTANKGFGSGSAGQTVSFNTPASAPDVTLAPFAAVSETQARLVGSVNPNNQATAYHFEYVGQGAFEGNGFAGATQVPAVDAGAGSGPAAVAAAQTISGLSAGSTYHYRLVAANPSGQSVATGQFTTPDSGSCSNAQLRDEQVSTTNPDGTAYLPACMALEMVTPPSKFNQKTEAPAFSPSGDQVLFRSIAALADTPQLGSITDRYIATRGSSGWTTHSTRPPVDVAPAFGSGGYPCSLNLDFSRWTILGNVEGRNAASVVFGLSAGLDGVISRLSPDLEPINPNSDGQESRCAGGSVDASQFFFEVPRVAYLPGDPLPPQSAQEDSPNIYAARREESGASTVELLARDGSGIVYGGSCGSAIGKNWHLEGIPGYGWRGAISPDASRIYFSTRPTQASGFNCARRSPETFGNRLRIMKRVRTPAGPQITQVVTPECTRVAPACNLNDGNDIYMGASQEGGKVVFTTTRQLSNSDLDVGTECKSIPGESAGCDIYLHDESLPAGANLIQVSAGDATAPTPGAGAGVVGVADMAGDGSHIYFVATGVLTTKPNAVGRVAEPGKPNLYLYERDAAHPVGRTAFIGSLFASTGTDADAWEGGGAGGNSATAVPLLGEDYEDLSVGGDGHILVFTTSASLTPDDEDDGRTDIYRYDADLGSLQRLSVAAPGGSDNGAFDVEATRTAEVPPQGVSFLRRVSEDGRTVVFGTPEALDPSDTDGRTNTYVWHDGVVTGLAGSLSSAGLSGLGGVPPSVSLSGDEVAFVSPDPLLPEDGDATKDVYVTRTNGGFPLPVAVVPCAGEACQGQPNAQPTPPSNASELTGGSGNVGAQAQKKTKKPKKHKKKLKKKSKNRHANANRRAGK